MTGTDDLVAELRRRESALGYQALKNVHSWAHRLDSWPTPKGIARRTWAMDTARAILDGRTLPTFPGKLSTGIVRRHTIRRIIRDTYERNPR